jgi:hypothetical protein
LIKRSNLVLLTIKYLAVKCRFSEGKAQASPNATFNTVYPLEEQALVILPEVVRCIALVQRFECTHQARSGGTKHRPKQLSSCPSAHCTLARHFNHLGAR